MFDRFCSTNVLEVVGSILKTVSLFVGSNKFGCMVEADVDKGIEDDDDNDDDDDVAVVVDVVLLVEDVEAGV